MKYGLDRQEGAEACGEKAQALLLARWKIRARSVGREGVAFIMLSTTWKKTQASSLAELILTLPQLADTIAFH